MLPYSKEFKIGNFGVLFSYNKDSREDPYNFSPFSIGGGQKDFFIEWHWVSEDSFIDAVKKQDAIDDHIGKNSRDERSVSVLLNDNILISKDFAANRCKILTSSDQYVERIGVYTNYYNIEAKIFANLCFLVSQFSIKHNGIILHGAGLVRKNNAYIFFAQGEGGKTTLIQQNSDFHTLSDDQIFFTISESDSIQADATPFGTLTDGPALSDVKGFFFIRKSNNHKIRRADNLTLLRSFIYDNSDVFNSLPKHIKKMAFELLHKIAFNVPVFEVETHYGHIDWEYLDTCVREAETNISKSGIYLHKDLIHNREIGG